MPVTTLNRTIAMFIVGGAPLAWWVVRHLDSIGKTAALYKDGGAVMAILVAFLLIPCTAVLGTVIEGIADFVRYWLVKKTLHSRTLARFFFHKTEYEEMKFWTDGIVKMLKDDTQASVWHYASSKEHVTRFVAGYFLARASKEQIDWLNSHYSSYTLSSSLAMVSVLVAALDIALYGDIWHGSYHCGWIVLEVALVASVTYGMFAFAVDMFLYSYHMAARFTYIDLAAGKSTVANQIGRPALESK